MNQLTIPYNQRLFSDTPVKRLNETFDYLLQYQLEYTPWPKYPYKPDVRISAIHNGRSIFLKFYVVEESLRAAAGNINGNVWEDSCVEFFIAFDEQGYYNIEMNCIGAILVGFGKGKDNRVLIDEEKIRKIRYAITIENYIDGLIYWELTAVIPIDIFSFHQLTNLSEQRCRGNFYKCGDNLPRPHFLAWNNIQSEEPNFHLSSFFGDLLFD